MTAAENLETVHASAVLAGNRAVVIRGPSGAGKSQLAFALIEAAPVLGFVRLVGDDRVILEPANGRLLVRPAPALAGLLEIRGLGIRSFPYEPIAVAGLIVDLADPAAARMPQDEARFARICGIRLPRLAAAPGVGPAPLVLAALRTGEIGV